MNSNRIFNRIFTCCFIANFVNCLAQFIVNPIIESYVTALGADDALLGILFGMFYGVAFVLRVFSGVAITRYNKKYIMIAAYTIGFIVYGLYALSSTLPVFIIARILNGVQFAFLGSINLTIASDSLQKEKLGRGVGLFGAGGAIATALAPGLGMFLRNWGTERYGGTAGFTIVFAVATVLSFLSIIPCIILPYKPISAEERSNLGVWYKSIAVKSALLPAVVMVFLCFASMLYTSKLDLYAKTYNIPNIGIFFTVYALVMLVSRPLCGILTDKFGSRRVIYPASALFAVSFILVGTARSFGACMAAAAIAAIGYGAAQPAVTTMSLKSVDPLRRAVAANTSYFGIDLGYCLGPAVGGIIASRFSYATMYNMAIIPIGVAVAVLFAGSLYERKRAKNA